MIGDDLRRRFLTARINLNPGTLGTLSTSAREAMAAFFADELHAWPLGQYQRGRDAQTLSRARAEAFFGIPGVALTAGTTGTANLLLLSLLSRPPISSPGRLRVLSTHHEHHGGLAGFEHHPAVEVGYLGDEQLRDPQAVAQEAARGWDALFLSHVSWTEGRVLPIDALFEAVAEAAPGCLRVVDAAQSLGLLPPPVTWADLCFGSGHKWMHLPPGSGFLWASPRAQALTGGMSWCWEALHDDRPFERWEPAGGQDFSLYAGVAAGLELLCSVGQDALTRRCQALGDALRAALADALGDLGVAHRFLPLDGEAAPGMVVVDLDEVDPYPAYRHMDARGVHVKCIKRPLGSGRRLNALRFGVPFFEEEARLLRAVEVFAEGLRLGAAPRP